MTVIMRALRHIVYLAYYVRESDFQLLRKFLGFASIKTDKPKIVLIVDVVASSLRYNVSFKDYFCFRFYALPRSERKKWAGTGFLYEYQLRMNPKKTRKILENKILFLRHYNSLIKRDYLSIAGGIAEHTKLENLLNNPTGRLVLKGSRGQVGAEVEIIQCNLYTPETLIAYMYQKGYDLVEEYVIQHPDLNALSPSGLNTVRIITQLDNSEVVFLGARLRVSVNSPVDNMAAGNLAAPIDLKTGIVCGPGVYSDITKEPTETHPLTGELIQGFQVPFWKEAIELAEFAARNANGNRSIGWDISITEYGPDLIEGNHNWCKLLWQMPVNRGLKSDLLKYS